MSQRGDSIVRCENPDCQNTGTYETGSFRHNPAPEVRQVQHVPTMNWQFYQGFPNYKVVDGKKVEDGY